MRARASLFATIAVVALGACKDSGLPDRNLPIDEAMHRPPDALVQAVHPETRGGATDVEQAHGMPAEAVALSNRAVRIGEQTFVPSGGPVDIRPESLRPIGASGGLSFHALRGTDPPYDRVFMSHPGPQGQYVTYMPVHDESGDPHARQATMERGMMEH